MGHSSSSPVCLCDTLHASVRTDQTQQECAHEHACQSEGDCPLSGQFVEISESYRCSKTWE